MFVFGLHKKVNCFDLRQKLIYFIHTITVGEEILSSGR